MHRLCGCSPGLDTWDATRLRGKFCTLIVLRITLMRRNAKRNEVAAAGIAEAKDENTTHAFEDLTDKENTTFRYQY